MPVRGQDPGPLPIRSPLPPDLNRPRPSAVIDPHPGNLIRTPDGQICLLDFGLMAEVSPEQRSALIEFIAHLTTKNWSAVAQDMFKLGFIEEGAPDPHESGLVHALETIMGQIVDGGGAGKISITQLMTEMEGVAEGYPLRVPPYL